MTTVREAITVNATRAQIRPIFFDPESIRTRETSIYHYQPDADWPAVGAKYEVGFKTFLTNIDGVATCLAYDPETMRLEYEMVGGTGPASWLYTFDERDGTTTISLKIDYTLPGSWLGQVVDRLLVERRNRQQVIDSLAALKRAVEAAVAEAALETRS